MRIEMKAKPANSNQAQKKPNIVQVFGSVAAAAFGVQSSKNKERDFKKGKLGTFVAAGIIFTALFVLGLYLVVSTVLGNAS